MQLTVPDRTPPENGSFDSNPALVKSWIDDLPMANTGETTRLLYSALREVNHQDIPAQQRFKTLELLSRPAQFVSENLKKHFVGQPLPLDARNLKIAHLSREIDQEMATGYKILVTEQVSGGTRKDKKLLVSCVHHALRTLGNVLLKTFQVYESCPRGLWLEIHSLYRYAEEQGFHRNRVAGDGIKGKTGNTIEHLYKSIVLLALACPYRLRHGEVEAVYQALGAWSAMTQLRQHESEPKALFCVNLDSDQPPTYLVLRDASEKRAVSRLLDIRKLSEHLAGLGSRPAEKRQLAEYGVNRNVLTRLMLSWGVMPSRRFSRTRGHSEVMVSMGLSSVHYFVSGEAAFNGGMRCMSRPDQGYNLEARHRASFAAHDTAVEQSGAPDLWEMNFRLEGEQLPSTTEANVARAAAGIKIDTSHRTQAWKMVNVSAGGYCLLWDNAETTRAQVGELAGIREQSDPDTFHWSLGVIRWLKHPQKSGLELGIEMLSPGATAIEACTEAGSAAKKPDYTRGLLLPEIASIQQQATLLLPGPPFRAGDTAVVNCHGKEVRVRLTKQVENTGSFAQFLFTSLGEVTRRTSTRVNSISAASKDFDDVWDLI